MFIGLEPRSCITLHAFTSTENGNKFESMAHLIADKNGMPNHTALTVNYIAFLKLGLFLDMPCPTPG